MTPALLERGRLPLASALRGLWIALGGPACVAEAVDLAAADRFFALLSEHAVGADVPDWPAFAAALGTLYAEPEAGATARVQIMTLHRAKGLQFDVVVMPGLGRRPRANETHLLLWRRRANALLLAPMKRRAVGSTDDAAVYAYLRALAKEEDEAELGRLLYVGSTRAKHHLHLTAVVEAERDRSGDVHWKPPPRGTALAALWPVLSVDLAAPAEVANEVEPARAPDVPLVRLPLSWRLPPPAASLIATPDVVDEDNVDTINFNWVREGARQIGTLAHRLLRRIGEEGIDRWTLQRVATQRAHIERDLASLGFSASERSALAGEILAATANVLQDARGRWLFDARHTAAQSEYALTVRRDGGFVHYVLDRTFIDADAVRWIVDFKLSSHEGGDREGFLAREQERYRAQLEAYARVMQALDDRPIRLGLYFPLLAGGWREWPYEA